MIVEFGLDLVTRSALTVAVLLRWILRIRVAALNHEAFDDPVKNGAVVETLPCELLKILNRVWRGVRPKLHHHIAFAGFNYGDFI